MSLGTSEIALTLSIIIVHLRIASEWSAAMTAAGRVLPVLMLYQREWKHDQRQGSHAAHHTSRIFLGPVRLRMPK